MKTLLRKITVLQRHRTTFRGGGTPHRKTNTGIGDIAQTFLMRGTNGWGKIYPAHTLLRGGQLGWGHRTTLKDQTHPLVLTVESNLDGDNCFQDKCCMCIYVSVTVVSRSNFCKLSLCAKFHTHSNVLSYKI